MTTIIKSGATYIDLEEKLNKTIPSKKLNSKKFSGILKIEGNILDIQTKLRNEWK